MNNEQEEKRPTAANDGTDSSTGAVSSFGETLSLPALTQALATAAQTSTADAQAFIVALSDILARTLVRGEEVQIKGIGTLTVIELGGEPQVKFAPEDALAEKVNAPFSMFEAQAIPAALSDSDIALASTMDPELNPKSSPATEEEAVVVDEKPDKLVEEPNEHAVASEPVAAAVGAEFNSARRVEPPFTPETPAEETTSSSDAVPASPSQSEPVRESPRKSEPEVECQSLPTDERSHTPFLFGLSLCAALLIGLVIGYFAYSWINLRDVKSVNIAAQQVTVVPQQAAVVADTLAAQDTTKALQDTVTSPQPKAPAVVYDTVRPGRFLTTMALRHYGDKKFWVYIYQENASQIADPDNLSSGTVVVIPPASKYDIDASSPASRQRAAALATTILSNK